MSIETSQLDLFYNTTNINGNDLLKRQNHARGQCIEIIRFFSRNPQGYFTPFEVQQQIPSLMNCPITSIRRAINTLTEANLLIKTDVMKPGEYGADNHCWRLA
jgi:hypothetical protein